MVENVGGRKKNCFVNTIVRRIACCSGGISPHMEACFPLTPSLLAPSVLFCSKPCLQKNSEIRKTPELRFTDMPAYMPYLYKVIFNSWTQPLEHRNIDRGRVIMPLGRLNFGAWCLKMLNKKQKQTTNKCFIKNNEKSVFIVLLFFHFQHSTLY